MKRRADGGADPMVGKPVPPAGFSHKIAGRLGRRPRVRGPASMSADLRRNDFRIGILWPQSVRLTWPGSTFRWHRSPFPISECRTIRSKCGRHFLSCRFVDPLNRGTSPISRLLVNLVCNSYSHIGSNHQKSTGRGDPMCLHHFHGILMRFTPLATFSH